MNDELLIESLAKAEQQEDRAFNESLEECMLGLDEDEQQVERIDKTDQGWFRCRECGTLGPHYCIGDVDTGETER